MNEAALTLLTLAGVVVLFVSNRVPVEIVAVGSALVLYGLGIISLTEALAGFADPAVLLIGALFVVSRGPGRHGRDHVGGAGGGQPCGDRCAQAAALHDAALGRAHRAHRAERGGGGACCR